MTPLTRRIRSLLDPLDSFYQLGGRPLPNVVALEGDAVPQPQRRLLVHERDLTGTLESYCGRSLHLRVLRIREHEGDLHRQVVLLTDDAEAPMAFGAIRIHLGSFGEHARTEIRAGRRPLGTLLHAHAVEHRSRPSAFFRIDSDALTRDALHLDGDRGLYGRHNVLSGAYDQPLAEVVEILPPFEQESGNDPSPSPDADPDPETTP